MRDILLISTTHQLLTEKRNDDSYGVGWLRTYAIYVHANYVIVSMYVCSRSTSAMFV